MRRTALLIALTLAFSNAFADDNISHVNGGITAEAGQRYGNLSTVNGGINLESGALANALETVNGGITLDDGAKATSANTVNGGIKIGERVTIANEVETVNGGIRIGFHSRVGGDVGTINGRILIQQTEVGGRVRSVSGDITIGAHSLVHGVLVEKPKSNSSNWTWITLENGKILRKPSIPRIVIGPNAVVEGELRFEREVELFVHDSAKIGKVIGAVAKPYTDTLPPRS